MLWTTLIASCALALPPPSAQDDRKGAEEAVGHLALLEVSGWPELLARDARAGFSARSAVLAAVDLAQAELPDARQAAALLALGESRVGTERPRILTQATEGKGELRIAAVWALGALRAPSDVRTLSEQCDAKRVAVAQAALLALAINGTPQALEELRGRADDAAFAHAAEAKQALAFRAEPRAESPCARDYLALRFEAARRYGLIDGQAWEMLVVDDLAHSPKFLTRVVYRTASELRLPGIHDHFLEVALAGGPPDRLRGVVNAIPTELSQLVEQELFTPADDKEWGALLAEIEHRGLEPLTEPILRRAWIVPGLRGQVAAMLARAGAAGAVALLDVNTRSGDASERAYAAEGLGRAGDATYLPALAALEADSQPTVRAAALVARVLLGDVGAASALRAKLELDVGALKPRDLDLDAIALIDALVRGANEAKLQPYLVALLANAPERAKLSVATALLYGGHEQARSVVRERLQVERPAGEVGARAVAALGREASLADMALLRDLFPLGDDFDVDVELACVLLRQHDPEVLPILRAALWSEPWNRSVLAGALWREVAGLESLRLESERPPAGASARDLCRVGFALGEWGGAAEVERLAARVGTADPLLQGALLAALGARTH